MMRFDRCLPGDFPDDLIDKLTHYSFLGSPGFMSIWEAAGGTGVYWAAAEQDSIEAVLPGVEFRRSPVKRLQAMPDGCYARLYSPITGDENRAKIAARLLGKIASVGYARVYVPDFFGEFAATKGFTATQCETMLVNVDGPDWKPPDSKLRSEIRKAEREGVVVDSFVSGRHMEGFLHLMAHTERRHMRRPKYSPSFFQCLAQLAERDRRVRWFVVEHEGELAASHIYFLEGDMALNWQVHFDKRFSFLKPNQAILSSAAQKFASEGIKRLNLGASPPEAENLLTYKEKWGGSEYRYPIYTRYSWLGRWL